MKFIIQLSNDIEDGKLIFKEKEYSFDFEPKKVVDSSLLIGYLNLTIQSETKKLKSIWGMNPHTTWKHEYFELPIYENGNIYIDGDLKAGDNKRLIEAGEWKTYFNPVSGWVCVGNFLTSQDTKVIQFASNCMLSIKNGFIEAIWLKPIIVK